MRASRASASLLRGATRRLLPVVLACQAGVASAYDMTYLKSLLDATPVGGWVKASTGPFSDAVGTQSLALPDQSYTNPASIVLPWSSSAWDSTRGQLYIWGGGHANYIGNDMRVWSGNSGTWSLGSLPSRIEQVYSAADPDRTFLVVDDAAPQSAHTFDGNLYLPVNDMFLTFGDGVYNTGNGFQVRDSQGNLVKAGPWLWDPRKADPTKVGGTTGSGYNPATLGGEMWVNRQGQWTGNDGHATSTFLMNTSAYRTENGKDVVYVTKRGTSGGLPDLYRYTLGDVRNGGLDQWERVGISWNVVTGESTAVLDDANNLYVQTSITSDPGQFELHVWDLDTAGEGNRDIGVQLVDADGNEVRLAVGAGLGYNDKDGSLWLWDGGDRGTVWRTRATYNADGTLATQWVVEGLRLPGDAAQPDGNFVRGVYGKWDYVSELGAFVAIDEYSFETNDAAVWFYKTDSIAAAVPEVGGGWLMLAGLAGLGFVGSRRKARA